MSYKTLENVLKTCTSILQLSPAEELVISHSDFDTAFYNSNTITTVWHSPSIRYRVLIIFIHHKYGKHGSSKNNKYNWNININIWNFIFSLFTGLLWLSLVICRHFPIFYICFYIRPTPSCKTLISFWIVLIGNNALMLKNVNGWQLYCMLYVK